MKFIIGKEFDVCFPLGGINYSVTVLTFTGDRIGLGFKSFSDFKDVLEFVFKNGYKNSRLIFIIGAFGVFYYHNINGTWTFTEQNMLSKNTAYEAKILIKQDEFGNWEKIKENDEWA